LPWNFSGGYYVLGEPYDNLNHFIDGVDFPTTNFNDLDGAAFGLGNVDLGFSQSITTVASRPFSAPMEIGDVFSVDFDTPAEYVDLSPDDFGAAGYPFAIIGFAGVDDGDPETNDETFNIEAGSSSEFGDFPWRYDDATITNGDFGVAAGVGSITPTATSDGSSLSLDITGANTGRLTFDGAALDIQIINGLPRGVTFVLFDNDADDDGTGNPTGAHAFYFDNLKIESPGGSVPGDFSGNGSVGSEDLAQWRDDFAMNGDSDADGDGDSDGADFLVWQRNLGMSGAAGTSAAVPEPGSFTHVAAAFIGAVGARRRRAGRASELS
jgi:hypothetical protein